MDHWPPMCWVLIASIVKQLSSDVTMLKFCRGISCSGTMHCLVFPEKGYFKDFISYEDLDLPKSELTVKLIGFYWTFRKELFQVQGFLETYWMTYWKSYWWCARFYSASAVLILEDLLFTGGKNGEILRFLRKRQKHVLVCMSGYTEATSMPSGALLHDMGLWVVGCLLHTELEELFSCWVGKGPSLLVQY